MHGAGNDFVVFNCLNTEVPEALLPGLSRDICDRRFGVGGDGIILVLPSRIASFKMRMLNPDGSEAEMCGNGIRCFGKYVFDHGLASDTSITVETLAGIKSLKMNASQGRVQTVKVDMGGPEFRRDRIPMKGPGGSEPVIGEVLRVAGRKLEATCLSMGNPHCVIFAENLDTFPVEKIGPQIEHHRLFPQRTNVPMVQVLNKGEIRVRVWERGAGETLACGTGACAAAVASSLNSYTGREVLVHLAGGDLRIEWTGDNRILMEGPAAQVFTGEYPVNL